ncbi:MAG: DUF1501 domain-containing protein [Planctomycetaceae bacterium]
MSSTTRRQFLRRSSLIAMAPTIPLFLRSTAQANISSQQEHILVVIQLDGGNDGINTVVPIADEGYAKHRNELRLKSDRLIKLMDEVSLHPSLKPVAELFEDGKLAIVQGVGYPNPNRSHDVSMAIWQTARFDREDHKSFGWLGRAMDSRSDSVRNGNPDSILLGSENPPVALRGRRSTSVSLADLSDLQLKNDVQLTSVANSGHDELLSFARRATLEARATADLIEEVGKSSAGDQSHYPETQLASRLGSIAQLIKAGFNTPVYYAIQSGYDTHAVQLPSHSRLLRELAGVMKAFQDDLAAAGLADRVLTLCFSEFGRRVQENASLGTDHGTAGPVFVMGSKVNTGLIGTPASMTDLEDGDLKMQFDFRQVYATILDDWLAVPPEKVLSGEFEKMALVSAG